MDARIVPSQPVGGAVPPAVLGSPVCYLLRNCISTSSRSLPSSPLRRALGVFMHRADGSTDRSVEAPLGAGHGTRSRSISVHIWDPGFCLRLWPPWANSSLTRRSPVCNSSSVISQVLLSHVTYGRDRISRQYHH